MRRLQPLAVIVAIIVLSTIAFAQEPANLALDQPYTLDHAPHGTYGDTKGPEKFAADTAYRGELTDGIVGPNNHKAGEWVRWRKNWYTHPLVMTIQLDGAQTIGRVEAMLWERNDDDFPLPDSVEVRAVLPDYPVDAPVQIAEMEIPDAPEEGNIYRLTSRPLNVKATEIQLAFYWPTWSNLLLGEVRVFEGTSGTVDIPDIADMTFEAENDAWSAPEIVDFEGASGQAVLLDEPGESLDLSPPIRAGDYTIRIRSRAQQPDTFSEIIPKHAGDPMRPQPVTNNVFTWQRSHFTQPEDGPAEISIEYTEGNGVLIDQVRIHDLRMDFDITELCDFQRDTTLVEDGQCRTIIFAGNNGKYLGQAGHLADAIEDKSGARPPIRNGEDTTDEYLQTHDIIALGWRMDNFAIGKAAPNPWGTIPKPPEDGGPHVYIEVDPVGAFHNCLVAGGTDEAQVQKSVDALIRGLEGAETLTYPYDPIPAPELKMDRDRYRELAVETSKWIRQGAIRHLHRDWKYYPDDTSLMLAYRYIEYLDSPDTINRVSNDGFIDAETQKLMKHFDRVEHHGYYTPKQRLQLTNTLLLMGRKCAGIFDWTCVRRPGDEKQHYGPEETLEILTNMEPRIANNHQTFPAFAIHTAGTYFDDYYDLEEARRWKQWADLFMQGQLMTSKPQCDCWGYQDITMIHTARFAAVTDRWDYFEKQPINRFLQYRYINIDNLGSGVNHGDAGGYQVPEGYLDPAKNADRWYWASAGRLDLDHTVPVGLRGLYTHPLEPMWYDYYGEDAKVPLEDCFDKITFRNEVDPQQAYLLLDGLSQGYHGHWDGNSILRFTDNGRMWLCEGHYLKQDPREHNTVTVTRNATSGKPGMFSSLETSLEAEQWGATITRTSQYNGCNWDRHIIWHRPSDTFFLMDEFTALEEGLYDLKARFRSLGETSLSNRTWTVRQKGNEAFHLHLPGTGQLAQAPVPEDAENFARYEFVDNTAPQVLSHRITTGMQAGDRTVLPGIFYAQSGSGAPCLQVRRMDTSAVVTGGDLELVVGVGGFDVGDITASARQFAFGPDTLMINEGTHLQAGELLVRSTAPVNLSLNLESGQGILEAETPADVTIASDSAIVIDGTVAESDDGTVELSVTAGRHRLTTEAQGLQKVASAAYQSAFQAASAVVQKQPEPKPTSNFSEQFAVTMPSEVTVTHSADLDGDGVREIIVACADGTTAAIDTDGTELWRHGFGAKVNALDSGDLDGDGVPEIACGVEDSHLHILGADGSEKWKREFATRRFGEGHVRAVHVTDFEGEGLLDIAVACANAYCYVIDNTGETKSTNGTEWSNLWRHDGSAVYAADCNGDGTKEILVGHEYWSRWILDFTKSHRNARKHGVRGSKGGCFAITAADVDGDGLPEAIFGDLDGTVTAATTNPQDTSAKEVWQKVIGDGMIPHLLADDFDGDGEPEIAVASYSGFLALLEGDGTVKWVEYADNQVTDIAPVADNLIARSSRDGSVGVYDAAGTPRAWWHLGTPVDLLETVQTDEGTLVIAISGDTVAAGITGK